MGKGKETKAAEKEKELGGQRIETEKNFSTRLRNLEKRNCFNGFGFDRPL